MAADFAWPEFLETIIVKDTSCIPLELRKQEGKTCFELVEKPCYTIHELIRIGDDSADITLQDVQADKQVSEGNSTSKNVGNTANHSRVTTKQKARVRTWSSRRNQSVIVRITFETHK